MPLPSLPRALQIKEFKAAHIALLAALLVDLVMALYFQRRQVFFILDDLLLIVQDPHMHAPQITWAGIRQLLQGVHEEVAKRPLPLIGFMIDWRRGGGDPNVFYHTSVYVHALNAALVFILTRKILLAADAARDPGATVFALFAALLWAAHPIHLTAVAYIWQRVTALAALGVLAALVFYLYGRTAGKGRTRALFFGAALLAWLFGCLSKENAWIAPCLAALLEIGVLRQRAPRMLANHWERAGVAVCLALAALLLASIALGMGPASAWLARAYEGWDFSLEQRLLTQPGVVLHYLSLLVWPAPGRFAIEHDFTISKGLFDPPATALALGLILFWAAAALFLLARPGRRLYGALLLFPLFALAMESSIVPIDIMFEYRMYLPSVSLFVLAAIGLGRLPPLAGVALAFGLAVVLAICHGQSLKHWNSPLEVYAQAAPLAPTSIRVQYNYANELAAVGRDQEAETYYRNVFAISSPSVNRLEAIKMESVHFNLGLTLMRLGRLDEARPFLENATRIAPGHLKAHAFLVDLYRKQGNIDQALVHLDQILLLDPGNRDARELRQRLGQSQHPSRG